MPLPKCLSLADSGPNNRSSNDPSSGSENNTEGGKSKVDGHLTKAASLPGSSVDNPVDVVGLHDIPSSEPLPDVSGVATTKKMSTPTESGLDVIQGSQSSDVDVVSCENTQNLKREFINPKPAEEEGDGSTRKRGGEEEVISIEERIDEFEFLKDPKKKFKMMDLLNGPPLNETSYSHKIMCEYVQELRVAMGRKRATPLDPGVLSAPTRPRGFNVSAFGRHIPEGPHAATSYDDMDTESEDEGTGDEVNSNSAV